MTVAVEICERKTARDVLRHAALIIEERGWVQRVLSNAEGQVCALGAIYTAATGEAYGAPDRYCDEAAEALSEHVGADIEDWNDAQGRTAEQVIAALREAAR